jgi:hypothetical protein
MELGISVDPLVTATPPYYNSNTSVQANLVPFNPTNANFQKVQDIYGPGEFTGATAGLIDVVWVRMASTTAGAGPYTDFEVSLGQNIGTGTTSSTNFNTGLTSVYSNASYTTPAVSAGGWIEIPLSSSFEYDPTLSLVVEIKSTGVTGTGLNVYRLNLSDRRVYGPNAATTGGTVFNGPMELGLSISPIVLSTEDNVLSKILLYPNPSETGEFYLNIPQNINDLEVTIYNVLGAKVFSQKGFSTGNKVLINASSIQSNGIYIVKLTSRSKGLTASKKLMVN